MNYKIFLIKKGCPLVNRGMSTEIVPFAKYQEKEGKKILFYDKNRERHFQSLNDMMNFVPTLTSLSTVIWPPRLLMWLYTK